MKIAYFEQALAKVITYTDSPFGVFQLATVTVRSASKRGTLTSGGAFYLTNDRTI